MISAIILAAGQSKRMGQPKMLLPWGKMTVIEQVITTFLKAGINDLLVVTGGVREQVEKTIDHYAVRKISNEDYAAGDMLSSLQCGLRAMSMETEAVLIGLGDQPQILTESVHSICAAYFESKPRLIVPSFQMRRGHPWLVARPLWNEILELNPPESPRDFLNRHAAEIHYLNMDTPSILADMDTPQDYHDSKP